MIKRSGPESGQAMVEFALVIPLFAILLTAMFFSIRLFLAKLFLMQVVREGYFTMVYGDLSRDQTEQFLYSKFNGKATAYFPLPTFEVHVEKEREGLFDSGLSCVTAEGTMPLSGLSRQLLRRDGISLKAQLFGYAGTCRGAKYLGRITSKLSELFRKAGLPAGV